jgi:macrocin-O-methyltransferase TylF-like protien
MSAFTESGCSADIKVEHFAKYVRRQSVARFLAQYEIFKTVLGIKGSVVECGVHHGSGVMAWAKLSSTLEPYNYQRRIIGFDTFEGFPAVHTSDGTASNVRTGMFKEDYEIFPELQNCVAEYDANRFINHIPKIELVRGDAVKTIPQYAEANQHLLIALLYLDFDIYEPTAVALAHFLSRVPKGGVVAFDEINNANWPGETRALLEKFDLNKHAVQCFPFEPNISYIQL